MSTSWPPPPDLDSIRELVRNADIEGLIEIHGAPADEYEPEEDAIFAAIAHLPTNDLTPATLLPVIERIWRQSFAHTDEALTARRPALQALAQEIARFFGPDAL